ncbi:LOB domain-containing protein 20 isoform X2 [Tasmannia lanceolata]|uniref:LOB domain-containing protein 20 isoform X2 n=1 Tax=Tasmannia lanceolata TaxID=3420 RepID=UPI004062C8D6
MDVRATNNLSVEEVVETNNAPGPVPPCGACKFLRRKCMSGCIFSPYFGSDQGAARFAAVHKVFGASNVSKLLMHLPASRRQDAVVTICYEAQARLSDPVYGCVSTIVGLHQQVAQMQNELSFMQAQIINCRLAAANSLSPPQPHIGYSNASSASNSLVQISNFPSNFGPPEFLPEPPDEIEEEGESQNSSAFADRILHRK